MAATMLLAGCGQNTTPDETDTSSVNTENADTSDKKDEAPASQKVTLNEVAHSIFYAPMYVAIEQGYFNDAGIDLDLVTGFGADKVMTAMLSGEADIGFMGPETTVYTANEGSKDPVVNFAQLTQRAGNFLVAREEITDFEWADLIGKDVLGGRAGGMPEMVFEYILKQNSIDPSEVNIDQSIDFGSTGAAFTGGQGEYTVEFEPGATLLEQENAGYVVASLGVDSGYVPYTAFSAKTSYMEKHPDVIRHLQMHYRKAWNMSIRIHRKKLLPSFSHSSLRQIPTPLPQLSVDIRSRIHGKPTLYFPKIVSNCYWIFWKAPDSWKNARITKMLLPQNTQKKHYSKKWGTLPQSHKKSHDFFLA